MIDNGLQIDKISNIPAWRLIIDPDSVENSRALRPVNDSFSLNNICGEAGLETITSNSLVSEISQELEAIPGKPLDSRELVPPNNIRVLNLESSSNNITEESLFTSLFDSPVVRMQVNDRYLYDNYRIVEKLGEYVRMAHGGGKLQKVIVYTWDAERTHIRNASRDEQTRAISQLQSKFPQTSIEFKRINQAEHDRYIILERENGVFARILFGKGLDFINKDGTVERTYIVIEDPFLP